MNSNQPSDCIQQLISILDEHLDLLSNIENDSESGRNRPLENTLTAIQIVSSLHDALISLRTNIRNENIHIANSENIVILRPLDILINENDSNIFLNHEENIESISDLVEHYVSADSLDVEIPLEIAIYCGLTFDNIYLQPDAYEANSINLSTLPSIYILFSNSDFDLDTVTTSDYFFVWIGEFDDIDELIASHFHDYLNQLIYDSRILLRSIVDSIFDED